MTVSSGPAWLNDSVLYQIYPQTFADSDGDGIGDFAGVEQRLEYLQWLGVNTVWFSPCFASPFGDAGYDVADYLTVAPRYGTNDDLVRLVDAARARGIRIMLDLVAGHTSDQHPWFLRSRDDAADHRYVWAGDEVAGRPGWVPSPGPRSGHYLQNFFDIQPALNFGYARLDAAEPWRQPVDAEGPQANRAALREIMAYWLDRGVAGFRVDMAASLVKDDPGFVETSRLWREMRAWLDRSYPDAALLSEWSDPAAAVAAGFHADFFLHFRGRAFGSLWNNLAGTHDPAWGDGPCYFDAEGAGSVAEFLAEWRQAVDAAGGAGHIALPSSNHDFSRLACGPRTRDQLAPAFALLFTWPTMPTVYYGDEIGMRYVPGLPDKEGSVLGETYNRAGSRTPMQWDGGDGAGFSTAPAERFYLPLDPSPDRPDVAGQRADSGSLLHTVRRLIALRRDTPALRTGGEVEVLHAGYPFVYVRGGTHLVVVHPRREPAAVPVPNLAGARPVDVRGVEADGAGVTAGPFSYGIFLLDPAA
ncbi:alpha-amylase family glycosyl hydrolase [Catellatospora citrea]|uniref:Alpha-amylase n=1 Tax=Catellatospora citrea TaxID=53366 RepID=A0A8J3KLS1_9ACTN|nr:alpha-amylase family glycosyl hydrolase [Catellatospora citrea]RKE06339.1 trehalose synthase [Catellatospora citrea]GIG01034.1 alpha-amylase [Catellatospora citrea]